MFNPRQKEWCDEGGKLKEKPDCARKKKGRFVLPVDAKQSTELGLMTNSDKSGRKRNRMQ